MCGDSSVKISVPVHLTGPFILNEARLQAFIADAARLGVVISIAGIIVSSEKPLSPQELATVQELAEKTF